MNGFGGINPMNSTKSLMDMDFLKDSDNVLILILILMLMKEKSNQPLVIALMSILMQ